MNITNSVIVCTRNRPQEVINFLDSLAQQTKKPNEVIIVDSSDIGIYNHQDFINRFSSVYFPHTKLIYKHTNPGLTHQRNVGVNAATGDIVHFFDDDVILEKDYLEQMDNVFAHNPEYAGGMGAITNIPAQKKSLDNLIRKFFMLQRIYASGTFTFSGMPKHPYGIQAFKKVDLLGGGLTAYRSWVFNTHHFDENLKTYAYMEDCDFSRRVSYEHPLFYNPKAKLAHFHSPSARDKEQENRAMYIRNYSYLFFKNFYPKNKLKIVAYLWSILGLFTQAIVYRNTNYLKGYYKGLTQFIKGKK